MSLHRPRRALAAPLLLLAALAGGALPRLATAQVQMGSIAMWNTNHLLNQQIVEIAHRPLFERRSLQAPPDRAAPAIRLGEGWNGARSDTPRRMAAQYPPAAREQTAQLFGQLLIGWRELAATLQVPADDVGAATAALIAGSWMAYRDRDLPDAQFVALVAQMRAALAANRDFQRLDADERRVLHEQLAIIGVQLALTREALKARPDERLAAGLRRAGAGYLQQLLRTDPARVDLGAAGMVMR